VETLVEGWTEWVFGPGFRLSSRFFVVYCSFLVACFAPGGWGGVVVGKWLPPLQSYALEGVRDWVSVIAALHHAMDKVEKPGLDSIRHHNAKTSPIT
jgi:hypothetical protein